MWLPTQALLFSTIFAIAIATTSKGATTSPTPLTCPYRTVNYITHGLPQQCLTSSRRVNITSSTAEAIGQTANLTAPAHATNANNSVSETSVVAAGSTAAGERTTSAPVTISSAEPDKSLSGSSVQPTQSRLATVSGTDEESPLEDVKFLSFEDWKQENLKKAGQSEHVGSGPGVEQREMKRRPTIVHDSLDSLGDDAEIDLDFSGFVSDNIESPASGHSKKSQEYPDVAEAIDRGRAPRAGVRSKDAGTTCKERFNYASFDCAASILKTNPEAKGASAVLGKNKDSYMLNECSAQNKFLILELCNDISIDTIVVANFEFFSSTFRTFRVSVSDKYPVKMDKWKILGNFEARNTRDVQAFLVENPAIWARYLRIEFLTHYGNEYYCPVSLVRVHGTTMLEEYKHDLASLQAEDDETEAVAEPLLTKTEPATSVSNQTTGASTMVLSVQSAPQERTSNATQSISIDAIMTIMPTSPNIFYARLNGSHLHRETLEVCKTINQTASTKAESIQGVYTPSPAAGTTTSTSAVSTANATNATNKAPMPGSSNTTVTTTFTGSQSAMVKPDPVNNSSTRASATSGTVNGTKGSISSTQAAAAAAPTMQESFFKSVQKRLQMLESNSSLSLMYIEEQSRALRDAFQKVEQRQLAKTTSFLDYLNTTVLNELRDFRQQYDQLWQSTVIELEIQRERYQQENLAINARLGVLADEVIFQQRMSILQMILILICLGLVLFSRGPLNSYLEMPLVQNMLARSPSSRWLNTPSLETPSQSPPARRTNSAREPRSRHGILKGHRRLLSEDSIEDAVSPSDLVSPPTPVSLGGSSDVDDAKDGGSTFSDPHFDPSLIERPNTSPPVLPGIETPDTSTSAVADSEEGSMEPTLEDSDPSELGGKPPFLVVEDATPSKRLSWRLPEG